MLTKLLEGDKGPVKHEGRKRTVRRSQGGAWGSRGVYLRSYPAATVYTKERSDLLHFSSPKVSAPLPVSLSAPLSATLSALSYQLSHGQAAFDRLSLAKQLSDEQPEFSPLFGNHILMCVGVRSPRRGAHVRCEAALAAGLADKFQSP